MCSLSFKINPSCTKNNQIFKCRNILIMAYVFLPSSSSNNPRVLLPYYLLYCELYSGNCRNAASVWGLESGD